MKKIFTIFIISFYFGSYIHGAYIEEDILNKLSAENGILSRIYDHFTSENLCIHNEELYYYIITTLDTNITNDEKKKITEVIDKAFEIKYEVYRIKTKCTIPKFPLYITSENQIEPTTIKEYSDKDYFFIIKQNLKISKIDSIVSVKIDTAIYYKVSSENITIDRATIKNTCASLDGKLYIPSKITYMPIDKHRSITEKVDNLIKIFWDQHEIQKGNNDPYLGSDYVKQNETIFNAFIKPHLSKIASSKAVDHVYNFITRFMGNEYVIFYDFFPINNKSIDLHATARMQNLDIAKNEYYSLYKINVSEKKHVDYNFKLPSFSHYVTITDTSLFDIFMTYPSEKYENDLFKPLITMFDSTLGEKFYHDIARFFYGFTTALTIQDFKWIDDFYLDIAIRNYYPGKSYLNARRKVAIGNSAITKGYRHLFEEKRYEIYVTLNEGTYYDKKRVSTTWVYLQQYGEQSMKQISDKENLSDSFIHMPAFILKIKMDQKWHTIDRINQGINLEDTADVYFTLLCMNMDQLNTWLSIKNYDQFTIFTLTSYLQDLWNDMLPSEKRILRINFTELHKYILENEQIFKEIKPITITEEQFHKSRDFYLKPYKEKLPQLASRERFNVISNEFQKFFNSSLRVDVHTRSFLFNICYLKIFCQITKVDQEKTFFIDPKTEKIFYELILEEN